MGLWLSSCHSDSHTHKHRWTQLLCGKNRSWDELWEQIMAYIIIGWIQLANGKGIIYIIICTESSHCVHTHVHTCKHPPHTYEYTNSNRHASTHKHSMQIIHCVHTLICTQVQRNTNVSKCIAPQTHTPTHTDTHSERQTQTHRKNHTQRMNEIMQKELIIWSAK